MKENGEGIPPPGLSDHDHTKAVLKARARVLARPADRSPADDETLNVVEFRLAHERYAIEQKYVREIQRLKELTPLPCTPAFMRGIINLRGQFLPVIDIKRFFDLPEEGITDIHMVLVVRVEDMELGILADALAGVSSIPITDIQPSMPTLTGIRAKYLKGVTHEHVVILDVLKMLNDPKIVVNEEVEQ